MAITNFPFERRALNCWALITALTTFILLCSGGLVTSKGVGLVVPDWPNTYGYNMFLFPVSRWVGGIFYEHTHRLIASAVGLMTLVLTVWLLKCEPRRWVRVLGICALIAVVIQGLLGGFRVVLRADEIGIFHGMLAQSFFVAVVVLTIVTSRRFIEGRWVSCEPDPFPRRIALVATLLIFIQLGLGATMRHEHIGLSIPDFPLAYGQVLPDTSASAIEKINTDRVANDEMPTNATQIWIQLIHRFNAVLIFTAVIVLLIRSRQCSRPIRLWTKIWLAMIGCQIGLGAWTIWSNKAADVATAHQALGALSLVVGFVTSFRLFWGMRAHDFILPEVSKSTLMEHPA